MSDKREDYNTSENGKTENKSTKSHKSEFAKQTLFYLPAIILPGLFNFLSIIVYTRLLSADAYGRYAYLIAVLTTTKTVIYEWLVLGVFRFYQGQKRKKRLPELLSTSMIGFIVISIIISIVWVIGGLVINFNDMRLGKVLWMGLPLLIIWAMYDQVLHLNRASIKPIRYGAISASRAIISFGIAIFLLHFTNLSELSVVLGLTFGTLLPILFDLPNWLKKANGFKIDKKLNIALLKYGLPLAITAIIAIVATTSDRFLIKHFLESKSLGLFAAGSDLANQIVTLLFMMINLSIYPLLIKSAEKFGYKETREKFKQYSIYLFAVTVPATVGLIVLAGPIAKSILGQSFRDAAIQLIPWIAVASFLRGFTAFFYDLSYQISYRTDLQIWPVAGAGLINIILNIIWIPKFGLIGAAYAAVCSSIIELIISFILSMKVYPLVFSLVDLIKISISTFVMAISLNFVTGEGLGGLILQIFFGASVYSVIAWILDVGKVQKFSFSLIIRAKEIILKK